MPQFKRVAGDNLIGFINNGGVIARGRIRNCGNLTEDFAPGAGNRYRFQEALPMPNISDLGFYVQMARTWNGGTPGADGVWGNADDTGGATLTIWDDRLNGSEGGWRTYRGCIGCGCANGAATGCTGFCRPNLTTLESPYMVLDGRSPSEAAWLTCSTMEALRSSLSSRMPGFAHPVKVLIRRRNIDRG